MASQAYYSPSSSTAFSGTGRHTPIDPPQRPSSAVFEKLQAYPPDVYTNSPQAAQPFPSYPAAPARFPGRSYSPQPESPVQIGRSAPGWSLPQIPEPSIPVHKTYKTFLQWKAEAQATTADYQRNGFPSPVAWVYVEGHAIPPNAVIGGVDRKGPWHIARTFYEGSMELGKSGRHFRLGASISYHGKERDVETYEVLVEAGLPIRWGYQSLPSPPLDSLAFPLGPRTPQVTLADLKLVVIIDDSDSMDGALWLEARDALAGVAELSRLKGGDGVDIHCLNGYQSRRDLRGESEVRDFFNSIIPEGQTPIGAKLRQILDIYVPKIEDPTLHHKPISVLFITDGVPTDDPLSVIIEFARRLDTRNVPLHHLGIQFVQIGDDPGATEALDELGDQLGPTRGTRDMVNITTFSPTEPRLHDDFIIRTVLKAINSTLNSRTTLSSVTSPPGALPFASHPAQPARKPKLAYSQHPESPVQRGRPASGLSFPQIPQLPTPVQKTHKTFLQWKADAQEITTEYQRNGFSSPVAWVYVEGHTIPPNAVIGGVDRKGQWHVARTFYEGSIELGKAGRHFRLGASISYHGKERDIETYEVLVEASLPIRWVHQSLISPPRDSIASPPAPRTPPQVTLADFKLVVIVDDSDSMGGALWSEARDALAGVAELSRMKDGEGLDIYCLNGYQSRRDLRGESEVHDFFNSITPEGQTPIGAKLRQILNTYVPKIEDSTLHHKPISILVITDGVPTDDPKSVIIEFARRLDARNVPPRQLGIQFVQIGDDPGATEALKELDDQLGPTHGIRDMVDTTPFSASEPHLRADLLIKIVLGAINSTLDNSTIRSLY